MPGGMVISVIPALHRGRDGLLTKQILHLSFKGLILRRGLLSGGGGFISEFFGVLLESKLYLQYAEIVTIDEFCPT